MKNQTRANKKLRGFTDEERAAMQDRAKELMAEDSQGSRDKREEGERAVLAKIGEMKGLDRTMALRIHEIVKVTEPTLSPKTWYGMPAYAKKGKVICYFTAAGKFKSRYATLGFNEGANLDEGDMWPTSFAITKLTAEVEAKIVALIKKSVR